MSPEELDYIAQAQSVPWNKFKKKTIFVTGGTGLIGSATIQGILYASKKQQLGIKVLALVRNREKAEQQFQNWMTTEGELTFLEGSVENLPTIHEHVDYIIHGASPTASRYFIEHPVEVIQTSVQGTIRMLELAREKKVKGFLYLSSMEVYGEVREEQPLTEEMLGEIPLNRIRSCYPESKRMGELLCLSYAKEYQVPAKCIRLAQTFGSGVSKTDKRVFAMMANCALEGRDIVLQTKGESKHPYLDTSEAVTAILIVLLKGEAGETYNAANPDTYCSIWEMGELVAKHLTDGKIQVRVAEQGDVAKYPKPSYLNLDITKLQKLGWKPMVGLLEMYEKLMQEIR